jgi:hypothetical protein
MDTNELTLQFETFSSARSFVHKAVEVVPEKTLALQNAVYIYVVVSGGVLVRS